MNAYVLQMTESQQPIFQRKQTASSYMIGEEGENILCIEKPRLVIIPLFKVHFEAETRSFQGAQKFLSDRAEAVRGTLRDIFAGSLTGRDPEQYSMMVVLDHQGVTPVVDGFTVNVGIAALELDYFPTVEAVVPKVSSAKPTAAYLQKLWQYEGNCPHCGETGRLDPCGGAACSKHGFYQMQILPKPELEFETVYPKDQMFPFERKHLVNDSQGAAYYSDLLFGTPLAFPVIPSA